MAQAKSPLHLCFFLGFIKSTDHRPTIQPTTDQLSTDPSNTNPTTHSIIIFGKLDNRNIYFAEQAQLGKHIIILRCIIQKVYWFP